MTLDVVMIVAAYYLIGLLIALIFVRRQWAAATDVGAILVAWPVVVCIEVGTRFFTWYAIPASSQDGDR